MRHAEPKPDPTTARIHRVLSHIQANIDGDLSLDELAEVAALSRFHFHRVFRAVVGATVTQTVRRIRLNKAAALIVRTDQPISEIALACGYQPDSFARAFSEMFGQSPRAYRAGGRLRLPFDTRPKPETSTMPEVELRTMPATRLAAIAHQGAYPEIGVAFDKLVAAVSAQNLWPHASSMIAVFFDDPSAVPEADLRSLAGLAVADGAPMAAPLMEHVIPAFETAVFLHKGSYADLPSVYDMLYGGWLPASGRSPAPHASYEIYLNSPRDTAPEDLLTEICLPLAPA